MPTNIPVEVKSLNGELDKAPEGKRWFVVHTKPKREKKLAQYFLERDIYYFLPLNNSVRKYKYRQIKFTKPLFSGYMFAMLSDRQKQDILVSGYIANYLKVFSEDELLTDLRQIYGGFEKGAEYEAHVYFEKGTKVKIKSGPFVGLQGVVEDTTKADKLVLQIHFLRKAVSISIEPNQLEILKKGGKNGRDPKTV